jgi:hypothetical protein
VSARQARLAKLEGGEETPPEAPDAGLGTTAGVTELTVRTIRARPTCLVLFAPFSFAARSPCVVSMGGSASLLAVVQAADLAAQATALQRLENLLGIVDISGELDSLEPTMQAHKARRQQASAAKEGAKVEEGAAEQAVDGAWTTQSSL